MQIIATPDIPNMAKSQQEQYTPLGFCVKIRKHPQHCLQVSVHNFAFQLVNGQIATGLVRLVDKWPAFKHPLYKRQSSTGTLILHLLNVSNISQANLPKGFSHGKAKIHTFCKKEYTLGTSTFCHVYENLRYSILKRLSDRKTRA